MKWSDVFDPLGTVSDQRFEDVSLLEILYNGRFCWGRTPLNRSDGKPVAWQQFEYGFDDIGNRKVARRGGDENGWNLRQSLYTANLINQYTQRTVPGFVDIIGIALATKPVYVNGQLAYRKGEYFRRELTVNNASAPVWQPVTVTASGEPTITGNLFVPRTPEPFSYDLDGTMIGDGRWTYTWDAENRLLRVQSRSDTPQTSWRRVEWQYDAFGRRSRQTTWNWLVQSNLWVVTEDLRMVSDPLLFARHVLELNGTNNALMRSYVWGLDLSETMDGAGGVGGLLWLTLHTASGPAAGTHFVAYDGNGNVVALWAASDGSETARYEYGPFGEPIRVTGPAAALNPFRFSTKRTEPAADVVLYEYRAYSPSTGRWLKRDPIGELGGRNLYGFGYNNPIRRIDRLGLFVETCPGALKATAARCACKAAAAGTTGSAGGPLAAIACVAAAVAAELVAIDVALAMEVAALEKQNEQDAQRVDEKTRVRRIEEALE